MGKRVSNVADVLPVNCVTHQQIMPYVGDTSVALEAYLPTCSHH